MSVPAQTANDIPNAQSILDGLLQEVATHQAARVAGTPLPTYGKDGQSVSWESWFSMKMKAIEDIKKILQWVGGPTVKFTRARG